MSEKVKETLIHVLNAFESGDVPEAIAVSTFPIPNVPAAEWSLLNKTAMILHHTSDARGIRQWNRVNRYVKQGSKAFYILVPCFYKEEGEEGEEIKVLKGFKPAPVFRVEDTDGEPLDYQEIKLPELPLIQRAKEWGVSVKAVPGNYRYLGRYSTLQKEICLASVEEVVFFHELSHAAHEKVIGELKGGQNWRQEVVAELSAAVLCLIVGKDGSKHLGTSYLYISQYAQKAGLSPLYACLNVIHDVEQILEKILGSVCYKALQVA